MLYPIFSLFSANIQARRDPQTDGDELTEVLPGRGEVGEVLGVELSTGHGDPVIFPEQL